MTSRRRPAAFRAVQLLAAISFMIVAANSGARTFTDSAGRTVADPDTIITWDRNFYSDVWNDPLWQGVTAVRRDRVYLSPTAPFGWIDRPPFINRIIGLKWLSSLFYPERIELDLGQATREFYELFYHVELSEDELDNLIRWAKGRAPQ